ncbi:MAG TPA: DNA repair protein RecO [Verrucomicrobiota bacterium]|nr:DNA repair protein RecO [Verrucomicrobiota bacterium]HNU51550.1 DNA repair protein RecO [Verrucomicrobiota bacterium]
MHLEQASGIVLRTRLLTETSLIVHWLTEDQGRIATVAKGARRPRSVYRGKLDLFYEARFTFQRSRRSDLHGLRELSLEDTHPVLRTDLPRLSQVCYAALLIELASETDTPLPTLHALLTDLVRTLDVRPAAPHFPVAFELRLLADAGLLPDLSRTRLSAGSRQILEALRRLGFPDAVRIQPTGVQWDEIRSFLGALITEHWGRVPAGRGAALGGD